MDAYNGLIIAQIKEVFMARVERKTSHDIPAAAPTHKKGAPGFKAVADRVEKYVLNKLRSGAESKGEAFKADPMGGKTTSSKLFAKTPKGPGIR